MKKIIIFLLLIVSILTFIACGDTPDTTVDEYRVMVIEAEGLTVSSTNPVTVKRGESVTFNVAVDNSYVVKSVSSGTYDREAGLLTVDNVTDDLRIEFTLEEVDYDATAKYQYFFFGDVDSSIRNSAEVYVGSEVTVKATDTTRIFLGWSIGANVKNGGDIISDAREYTFKISSDMQKEGRILVYSNYTSTVMYNYDANGGTVNTSSENCKGSKYYTAALSGDLLSVTLESSYFSKMECASLFWDDGTFTRDGYILTEYNTKPDGTGESFSLGSKYFMDLTGSGAPTLYCIWMPQTSAADFTVEDYSYAMPDGVTVAKAPHWSESGVIIKSYTGNAQTVVIPEKIGGKYVIAIASGAFIDKDIKTLVMGKRLLEVRDGAFVGCNKLSTVYYPDSLYSMGNAALDEASYTSLKKLYVNATMAPRFCDSSEGAFSYKLSRLLASQGENRVIIVAGSSSYQGLSTKYLERLLESYRVINFGTTRTTNGLIYLEAISSYVHDGDIVIVSPENSIYMMGENELYWKTVRDLESMNNLWRYIDISNYGNVFGALSDLNQSYRYTQNPTSYEQIVEFAYANSDGDCQRVERGDYCNDARYTDSYHVTLNERVKSKYEGEWGDVNNQEANKDYTDPANTTWVSFNAPEYADRMNAAFDLLKAAGAKVYFAFAPTDADSLVDEAKNSAWLTAYDNLIAETYTALDGILGSCADYIFAHKYFYDCAFHPNDYGRAYRTYKLYLDLAEALGIDEPYDMDTFGTNFEGCLFEVGSDGDPVTGVDFLN